MLIYTVELQGHDGEGVQTFYLADQTFNTRPTDTPANTHFRPAIKTPPTFEQSISVMGDPTIGFGQIVIVNAGRHYDSWRSMAFDGRPCKVKAIDNLADYAGAPIWIDGVIEDIDVTDIFTQLRVRLYDRLLDLDKPLLTARYGGTTTGPGPTADGNVELEGAIIKRVYGNCPNFEADLANQFNFIWQLSDKALVSAAAYDGGMALTPTSNHATLADLIAADLDPGFFATALATPSGAYIRLGGQPFLQLTFDAVAGATEADRSPAAITKQMLLDYGIDPADLDADAFDALHAAAPGVAGLRVTDESTVKSVIQRMLKSVTGYLIPNEAGKWTVGRIEAPAVEAVAEFQEWEMTVAPKRVDPQDGKNGIPVYRVVTRYRYLGRAHTTAELDTDITDDRRAYLLGPNVYREVPSEDLTVKDRHLKADELILETCFINQADAKAEGDRILALRKVKRERWQFSVETGRGKAVALMQTIKMTLTRLITEGQNFIVLRRFREPANNRITFDVWG